MATKADLESFVTEVRCPGDFDSFWQGVRSELDGMPLDAICEADSFRSTETVKVYQARYRSLGGLEIFAWYALPAVGAWPVSGDTAPAGVQIGAGAASGLGREGRRGAVGGGTGQAAQQRRVQPRVSRSPNQRRRGSGYVRLQRA